MSEWFYIKLAYSLAWGVLALYTGALLRRALRAEQALRDVSEET
jgi:hypothetical protein